MITPGYSQKHRTKRYVLQSADFYGMDFSKPESVAMASGISKKDSVSNTVTEEANLSVDRTNSKMRLKGSVFISALNSAPESQLVQESSNTISSQSWLSNAKQKTPQLDYSDVFPEAIGLDKGVTVFVIDSLFPVVQDQDMFGKFCVADCYIVLITTSDPQSDQLAHRIYTWIGGDAEMDKKFCVAMFSVGLRNWIGACCRIQREVEGEESLEFLQVFGEDFVYEDVTQATETGLFTAEQKRYPLRLYRIHGKLDLQLCLVEPACLALKSESVFLLDWGLEMFQWNGSKANLQHRTKCRIIADRINKLERVSRAHFIEIDEWSEPPRFWEILGGQRTAEDVNAPSKEDEESLKDEKYFQELSLLPYELYQVLAKPDSDKLNSVATGVLRRSMLISSLCFVVDAGVELFLWLGKASTIQCKTAATELLAKVVASKKRPPWIGLTRCTEDNETEAFKLKFRGWDGQLLDGINWHQIKMNAKSSETHHHDSKSAMVIDVKALYTPPPNLEYNKLLIEDTMEHANRFLESFTPFVYSRGRFVKLPVGERCHFFSRDAYIFLCVYQVEARDILADQLAERRMSSRVGAAHHKPHTTSDATGSAATVAQQDGPEVESWKQPSSGGGATSSGDVSGHQLECVTYFWQGRHASRLAFSTFKLKTQNEMENLVDQMYHSPVRVVHLEQGREPIALLSHLDNLCMFYSGRRSDFVGGQKEDMPTPSPSILFHIKTDQKYGTTRAIQVESRATSLVSRDCFLIVVPGNTREDERYLVWAGKGASEADVSNAERAVERIIKFRSHETYVPKQNKEAIGVSDSEDEDDVNTTRKPSPVGGESTDTHPKQYEIIHEADKPVQSDQFWNVFSKGYECYSRGISTHQTRSPRFLRCSCSQGYFLIEEVLHYLQIDCRTDTCIILDPGAPLQLYVWTGTCASDVVRKLTRKSVEIWLSHLNDGRTALFDATAPEWTDETPVSFIYSGYYSKPKPDAIQQGDGDLNLKTGSRVSGDVVWIHEGRETMDFKSFFHGWDDLVFNNVISPGNMFLREQQSQMSIENQNFV